MRKCNLLLLTLSLLLLTFSSSAFANEPIRGGVQQNRQIEPSANETPTYAPYPTYQPPQQTQTKKIKAEIKQDAYRKNKSEKQPQKNLQAVPGYLPPEFLGVWHVNGSRTKVEASQNQEGFSRVFAVTTTNTWRIVGNRDRGYVLSTDSGVQTALVVETKGNSAILQYQHPINKTMAQEAVVISLGPGGAQFQGLESITIVKQGELSPRAKVTYKLIGTRK